MCEYLNIKLLRTRESEWKSDNKNIKDKIKNFINI